MEDISAFDLYLKFTKPFILNLPQIDDRILAAAWVKRLSEDETIEETIKLDHLKLLLFVLQRKKLAPPFTQHPNAVEILEKFPENQTLLDVAKQTIEKDLVERQEKFKKRIRETGDHPPFISDFSADLLEYVAVQTIDNFGTHGYYAISKEPLSTWHRVDKQAFPKAAKSMLDVGAPPITLLESRSTPEVAEKSPEKPVEEQAPAEEPTPEAQPEEEAKEDSPPPKKKTPSPRKSTLGASPPSRPIGKISPPVEDREPPTWGSNLLQAKFLEEDLGEIVEIGEGTSEPPSTSMELLWTSMTEEGPYFELDESGLLPPPPPMMLPIVSGPNRASVLLARAKKAASLEKQRMEKPVMSKGKAKQADKTKKVAKKGSKSKVAKKPEAGFSSPGEPYKGFPPDEIEAYVNDYKKLMTEMQDQYQEDLAGYREKYEQPAAPKPKIPKNLARMLKAREKIPASHDVPVQLDESIHLSPQARNILQELVGVSPRPPPELPTKKPTVRNIKPRLKPSDREKGVIQEIVQEDVGEEYASTSGQKDPRIVDTFNQMLDTSTHIETTKSPKMSKKEREKEKRRKWRELQKKYEKDIEWQEGDDEDLHPEFVEMETKFEQELHLAGVDPHKKEEWDEEVQWPRAKTMRTYDKIDRAYALLDEDANRERKEKLRQEAALAVEDVGEEEEDDEDLWTKGELFFLDADQKKREEERTPVVVEELSGLDDIQLDESLVASVGDEKEDLLEQLNKDIQHLNEVYYKYKKEDSPVTSPRHTVEPRRPSGSKGPIEDIKASLSPKPATEARRVSGPKSPPKTEEELMDLGEMVEQSMAKYRPEDFVVPYQSPKRLPPMERFQRTDTTKFTVSPERIYGPEEYPGAYPDSDGSGFGLGDETPPQLASPVEREIYVPIDDETPPELASPIERDPGWSPSQIKERDIFDEDLATDFLLEETPPFEFVEEEPYSPERTPQRSPDIFERLPHEYLMGESPPEMWASPVTPELSPEIKRAELFRDVIRYSWDTPRKDYNKSIYPNVFVARHSLPPEEPIHTIEEEYEPPEWLLPEDYEIRDSMKEAYPALRRRIQMPFKRMTALPPYGFWQPGVSPVKEQEVKLYEGTQRPDVPVVRVGPVPEPVSPKIHPEEFRSRIRERAMEYDQRPELIKRSRAPQLPRHGEFIEDLSPGKQEMYIRTMQSGRKMPEKDFPRMKKPGLSPIAAAYEYWDRSPVARAPAPIGSPGEGEGPRRRVIRKQLKKRRLNFNEEATTPEQNIAVTEIVTTIEEPPVKPRAPPKPIKFYEEDALLEDESFPEEVYMHPHLTPPKYKAVSPTTQQLFRSVRERMEKPESPIEQSPRTPHLSLIEDMSMPEGFDLSQTPPPVTSTPEPQSPEEDMEALKAQLRAHQHLRPREKGIFTREKYKKPEYVGKRPIAYGRSSYHRAFKAMHDVVLPTPREEAGERAAAILTAIEAEVDAEIAAQGIQSPVHVQAEPFYTTPPHLKRTPIKRRLTPGELEDEEFARLEQMMESGGEHVTVLEAEPMAVKTTADVRSKADEQYAALFSPKPPPPPKPKMIYPPERSLLEIFKDLDKLEAEEKRQQEAEAERQRVEFEYQERVKEDEKRKKAAEKAKRKELGLKGKYMNVKSRLSQPKKPPEPKKVVEEEKPVKGKKLKTVKSKSVTSVKSDGSVKSKKSVTSTKSDVSAKSDTSVKAKKAKPRKPIPKYPPRVPREIVSKLDTGRRKADVKMNVEYDMAALEDLGVTAQDLANLNLNDAVRLGVQPEADMAWEEYHEVSKSPGRTVPVRQPPVPTSQLKSELRAHQFYDPQRKLMQTDLMIKGRKVPMTDAQKPQLVAISEEVEEYLPQRQPAARPLRYRYESIPPEVSQSEHVETALAAAQFREKYAEELQAAGLISPPATPPWGSLSPVRSPQVSPPRPQIRQVEDDGLFGEQAPWEMDEGLLEDFSPQYKPVEEPGELFDEEPPWGANASLFEAVSPQAGLSEEEALALMETSTGDEQWGGRSPLPGQNLGYRWLKPSTYEGKWPWEED